MIERRSHPAATARSIAARLLGQVLYAGGNSSRLLEGVRLARVDDRALVTELVLGVLRRLHALDDVLQRVSRRPLARVDPELLVALRLGAYQLLFLDRVPVYAAVAETVTVVKERVGRAEATFANGVLRSLARRRASLPRSGPEGPLHELAVTLSLGPFLAERWVARMGAEATHAIAAAAVRPPPLTVRALASRGALGEIVRRLADEGVLTRPGRYLEGALTQVSGSLLASATFREGLAIVQDEAAQLAAELVSPGPGEVLLDACAAPGGKALGVADRAGGKALVIAADIRPARLARVRENLARTGLAGVHLVATDAARPGLRPGFARLLVDAPCTGTGTIRRNPELRYRVDAEALQRSAARARDILAGTVPLLGPGGRLVYSTCSLEPEENDEVVAWLRGVEPALRPVDARRLLPDAAHRLVGEDGVLRTQPADPELDGFTAFVLEREDR